MDQDPDQDLVLHLDLMALVGEVVLRPEVVVVQ